MTEALNHHVLKATKRKNLFPKSEEIVYSDTDSDRERTLEKTKKATRTESFATQDQKLIAKPDGTSLKPNTKKKSSRSTQVQGISSTSWNNIRTKDDRQGNLLKEKAYQSSILPNVKASRAKRQTHDAESLANTGNEAEKLIDKYPSTTSPSSNEFSKTPNEGQNRSTEVSDGGNLLSQNASRKPARQPTKPAPAVLESWSDNDSASENHDNARIMDESSSHEGSSHDGDDEPKLQQGEVSMPSEPYQLQPYEPPDGFQTANVALPALTSIPSLFSKSNLEGKQLWCFTAPSFVPIHSIKDVSAHAFFAQGKALMYDGTDYKLVADEAVQKPQQHLLVPNTEDNAYQSVSYGFTGIMHLQRILSLPNLDRLQDVRNEKDSLTKSPKSKHRQPENLKMRFRPSGDPGPRKDKSHRKSKFRAPVELEPLDKQKIRRSQGHTDLLDESLASPAIAHQKITSSGIARSTKRTELTMPQSSPTEAVVNQDASIQLEDVVDATTTESLERSDMKRASGERPERRKEENSEKVQGAKGKETSTTNSAKDSEEFQLQRKKRKAERRRRREEKGTNTV